MDFETKQRLKSLKIICSAKVMFSAFTEYVLIVFSYNVNITSHFKISIFTAADVLHKSNVWEGDVMLNRNQDIENKKL